MVMANAPVRVSFGGGGTDLPAYYERFGGFVVSAAISRFCYALARRPEDYSIRITSADYRTWQGFAPGELPPVREPLSLPKAVLEHFGPLGLRHRGIDLFLAADVPPGTGLGSSSAMAVALVRCVAAYLGVTLTVLEVAELASRLEIERLAMPIGRQDQYASAYGGINAITFERGGVRVEPLRLGPSIPAELSRRLLLFSTGRSRHSAQILTEQRRATVETPAVAESLHEIKALARRMCAALEGAQLDAFGRLLDEAWQHKKRLSSRISSGAIDGYYDAARAAGALGGKITGAGGGGYLLLYVPPPRQDQVRSVLRAAGLGELPFELCPTVAPAMVREETNPARSRAIPATGRRGVDYVRGH